MQHHAALANKWHLYSIFQHSNNAGSVPWQSAIHALVVEAIRRDEASDYHDHRMLGCALNGLLPRRARVQDLCAGGWADLAWLLELNQGFYNAASLAAVCSIADESVGKDGKVVVPKVEWLGRPIEPTAGNERLEPVVTAFPVNLSIKDDEEEEASDSEEDTLDSERVGPSLAIIEGSTLGFRTKPLKRDAKGLYNNEEIRGVKRLAYALAGVLVIISTLLVGNRKIVAGVVLYYITAVVYCMFELAVGTMYLERSGWAFLEEDGDDLERKLGEQDSNLRKLTYWGERQMSPCWTAPANRPSVHGMLIDLRSRVCVDVVVAAGTRPNALIPLAVHGSGVTCMLIVRQEDSALEEKQPTVFAHKVGMCNLPPYILAQVVKAGTVYIGTDSKPVMSRKRKEARRKEVV